MSNAVLKRLGDLINFKRGYDLPENKRRKGQYPVISSAGITGYHDEYMAEGKGVVTGRYGTLGEMYYIDGKYWPHNTALYVTTFKENDPKFIYYLLRCLGRIHTSDKSAVPGVNRNELHEMSVPVIEDRNQQIKIASILSTIDEKIDCNIRTNIEMGSMAKMLYEYWFVQFNFPNSNGTPYKTSGGAMVYNKELKRDIPAGWHEGSLWDIANFYNGLAMQKHRPIDDKFLPVIKIREMSDGISENTEKASAYVPETAIVLDGDVLFSWSATLAVKIWSQGKGALNQHIFKVTSNKFPKTFFYFELLAYLAHFKMMAERRKTTMGHITQDHLKQSRICIPPIELLHKAHDMINPMLEKQLLLEKENQKLVQLREWLLPMLMNGQVAVS